jgi:hypothetical protein
VVSNTATQTSAELVKITGTAGQTAFKVDTGNTVLSDTTISSATLTACSSSSATLTGGSINNMVIGGATKAAAGFTTATIDPNSAAGGGVVVSNTATQTSAELVKITGTAGQTAFKVVTGNTVLSDTTISSATLTAFTGSSSSATLTGGSINDMVIGGTTPAAGTFTTLSNSGGVVAASDRRFKMNITGITSPLSIVRQLDGKKYLFKTSEFPQRGFSDKPQFGFIAQEVEKILPHIVTTQKDGYKGISYSQVIPVLVEAVKEQQAEIADLKLQNAALRHVGDDIADLRSQIATLQEILRNSL